ncbi:MAG TPA: LysM peptidoglycan-binding domain-containing protein [Desulfatiglandales bacterium]|nr:LysM peptidoglycan-binding domain-containing protein [Desulfatiglandales bacterium]
MTEKVLIHYKMMSIVKHRLLRRGEFTLLLLSSRLLFLSVHVIYPTQSSYYDIDYCILSANNPKSSSKGAGVRNLDLAKENIRNEKGKVQHGGFNFRLVHIAGALLIITVIFIAYSQIKGRGADGKKLLEIDKRLGDIENRLNKIENTAKNISSIDEQRTKFEISLMNRIEGIESLIAKKAVTDTEKHDTLHMEAAVKKSDQKSETENHDVTEANIRYHQVLAGETLYRISLKYGLTVEELRRINKIPPEAVIYVGQRLKVTPAN